MVDSYRPVVAAMAAGTPHDLICATCPWDRICIHPPAMTPDQVKKGVRDTVEHARRDGAAGRDLVMVEVTALAINLGRDSMAVMCPVVAARLQSPEGRTVADAVRSVMRDVG
jgi:hypothetical protein